MVLHAGDMEWVLPGARLAPRGPARRPVLPELLRRPAGEQVRQGRAVRRRRRRAVRRLPVALLPRAGRHEPRRLPPAVLRLLAAARADEDKARASFTDGRPTARSRDRSTFDVFRSVFDGWHGGIAPTEDYVNASLYFELKTFLHGLLVVEDKLSMAHCLETRVPFLDNDLVDFALAMPPRRQAARPRRMRRASTRTWPASGCCYERDRATARSCCARRWRALLPAIT